jgi:hypothetical protein
MTSVQPERSRGEIEMHQLAIGAIMHFLLVQFTGNPRSVKPRHYSYQSSISAKVGMTRVRQRF